MGGEVGGEVGDEVGDEVGGEVGDEVGDEVGGEVGDEVGGWLVLSQGWHVVPKKARRKFKSCGRDATMAQSEGTEFMRVPTNPHNAEHTANSLDCSSVNTMVNTTRGSIPQKRLQCPPPYCAWDELTHVEPVASLESQCSPMGVPSDPSDLFDSVAHVVLSASAPPPIVTITTPSSTATSRIS